ncbi:SMC5-SMC6 complex localization factor protein 2 isoform X2 [Salarias fasciatus]|nr:SMC5-SMC6 complex localization factor protein 2-like isoform X2 [Salarias fasciatus]
MSRDRVGPPHDREQTVPGLVPVTPVNGDSPSVLQPSNPGSPHPASPQFGRKSKNDSPSSRIHVDQVPESKAALSNSGTKNKSAQGHNSDKCQQSERTTSNHNVTPVVEINASSHKNDLDCATSKSLHLGSPKFGDSQTAKPTAGDSQGNFLDSSRLEQALKARGGQLRSDACKRSACSDPTSLTKHKQSHGTSSPKRWAHTPPTMGAKQALLDSTVTGVLTIRSPSLPKSGEDRLKNRTGVHSKTDKSHSSPQLPRKDSSCSTPSHRSSHSANTTSASAAKPVNRSHQNVERKKSDGNNLKPASKLTSVSSNGPSVEKSKAPRARKHLVLPDDTEELFTPDPHTYVVNFPRKTSKLKTVEVADKTPTSNATPSSSTPAPVSSCHKTPSAAPAPVSSHSSPHSSSPKRVKLDKISPPSTKLDNGPVPRSGVQLKKKSVKVDSKAILPVSNRVSSHTAADTTASEPSSAPSSQHPQEETQASERSRKHVIEEDPVAMDLDLDLSLALDFDVTQSSQSSEDEQLISFKEIIERATKPPDTPEKGAFSEPSTPGHHSSQTKHNLLPTTTKPDIYRNNLDNILKEMHTNKRAKEMEMEHLTACKEDLLRIAEYEEVEEKQEEGISSEEQRFLQRYSLTSSTIREMPPGEVVFNVEKVGRIFDQDTLQLRHCMVNPQGTAQKTMLWSSPAQLRLYVAIGLFQEGYDYQSPCPTPVTRFLFKMMSIHSDRLASDGMLQALFDIAMTAAYEREKNGSHQFRVWVPSLADVTLILLNMGAAFVTLYPFENLQPLFTEGDLLEDVYVKRESSFNEEQSVFSDHNYNNVFKYLHCSLGLCPRAYSDEELLLLLTVLSRISLDPQLILLSSLNLYPLHRRIVSNFTDWDKMLPKICVALTDLTDDHHNMCYLIHLLPNSKRGRQLRQHLSMSMVSKLLDGNCTYRPTQADFQLSELRPYVLRMQPSSLLRDLLNSGSGHRDEENTLDQQAYYLCYSLLTLANEASNLQFFTAQQKEQLLYLSFELEAHVKSDIRESEKCLYRSKVKDLVARIYTKWQILLQKTRPLHNKLYDYWQPVDTLTEGSQEEQGNEETAVMDVDETAPTEQSPEEMQKETVEPEEDMELGEELDKTEHGSTTDSFRTEDSSDLASDSFTLEAPDTGNGADSTPQTVEM